MNGTGEFLRVLSAYSDLSRARLKAFDQLLAEASPILEGQREQDRLRPPDFNIFRVLGHQYREVSTHSALLAHLLDPAASHEQGALFLRAFLELVETAAAQQGRRLTLPRPQAASTWTIRQEMLLPDGLGQVDIVICGPGLLLLIENKIFAADQQNQLSRYWTFAQTEAEAKSLTAVIVYLTPNGDAPNEQSVQDSPGFSDKLVLLSYRDDIYKFIMGRLQHVRAISVAEILRQYAALVRSLA